MSPAVDATRGPLLGVLLRLAGPVLAMQLAHTLFHLVDVMWVGRLGASATAAVTTAFYLIWTLYALTDIVGVAVAATVARHVGAREPARAAHAAAQSVILAVVLGLALAIGAQFAVRPLFGLLGTAPDVLAEATRYLQVAFGGAVLAFLYVLSESTLRAAGDTRTPLVVITTSLGLNALLDPLFIFGGGPVPAMGVPGAALATVIAQAVAVAWFGALAWRRHPAFPLDRAAMLRPQPRYLLALARIGLPFALMGMLFSAVYMFLSYFSARFGTVALAILGVGNRVESITYLVAVGFGLACEAVVGQNLGARQPARAARAAWLSTGLMGVFALLVTAVMWFAPEALLGLFTSDPGVIRHGVPYLRVLAICQLFTASEIVLNGAFSGAGDTVPPMLITILTSVLRVPMAYALAFGLGLGLLGVAWTITLTCIARASLIALWFRRGAWQTKALATATVATAADALAIPPGPPPHPLPPAGYTT